MSWSYDPTDLNTTTPSGRLNTVRFLVGDTDIEDQKAQNEEIAFSLSQTNDDVNASASYIARGLASKYASKVTLELDGQLMAHYSDLYGHYSALADKLDRVWEKLVQLLLAITIVLTRTCSRKYCK